MRAGQIEHGEAEREPDRERKDLQAQQAVQLEATRQPATAAEEQHGLLPTQGEHRDDRDVVLNGERENPVRPPHPISPDCQDGR